MLIRFEQNSKAFSLIEMVVVLTIIAIIYTFAAPNLSRYNVRKKLQHETEKMADVIELVKSYSTTQRQSFKLVIDSDNKEYYYMLNSENGKQFHRDKIYHCDTSVTISSAPNEIAFGISGTVLVPTGIDDPAITLRGAHNYFKTITVNRRTGKITIT